MQRLADQVAGRFAYGVMGASAATFLFWSTLGVRMFPQVCLKIPHWKRSFWFRA